MKKKNAFSGTSVQDGRLLARNTYLEGSYSEIYPNITEDEEGMKKLFTQFSFPGGIFSHVAPTTVKQKPAHW